ncbi:MAG: hypothetical protein ACRD92_08010 [Nitrosopumilaceae archaeon]
MKKFSKSFPTFFDWKNQASQSTYAKRIERFHYKYPNATLTQLTGRARLPTTSLPLYKIDPRGLKSKDLLLRNRSLHVRTLLKKGQDLNSALESEDVSKNDLLKYLGDTIRIKGDKARVKKSDQIPRLMLIDEGGEEFPIVVRNSKDASIIGRYYNAKRHFLETGDTSELKKFSKTKIKDVDGNIHRLETDPDKIYEVEDRKEEPEHFEIYQS